MQRGLNFLFNNAEEVPIGQDPVWSPLGDPDVNGNGIGIAIRGPDGRARMYEAGIALMTMGSSNAPFRIATTGAVAGRTYLDITQDMVEFMAWAQNEHVDFGEFIYRDVDGSDDVSPGDVRLRVWWGGWEFAAGTLVEPGDYDIGEPLVPFAVEEKHGDPDANGEYEWQEPIYRDLDASNDVSIGDERLSDVGTYHAGSMVTPGDPDLGTALVTFAGDEKHQENVYWDFAYTTWTSGRGGWRYGGNSPNSDNSVSQWPVIGMEAAERNFGSLDLTVPDFVRPELLLWLDFSQCSEPDWRYGGFGYTVACEWVNTAKTGAGAAMLSWAGVPTSDPRFQEAVNFLDARWNEDWPCSQNFGDYYTMYGIMKGMRIPNPDVQFIGAHDWYAEYARYIVDEQNLYGGEYVVDHGCWGPSGEGEVQNALGTAWAMLILTPTVVQPPPVADAGQDVESHPPVIPVEFDGSGSYHPWYPTNEIVEYCWDFDARTPEEWHCSPDPTMKYAFPAVYNEDGTINWAETADDYVVKLRVIDNNVLPLEDEDTLVVHITAPPWKPVADADGPYEDWVDVPSCLDGSGSYDPESRMYAPGHPWYEEIATYEWDLDNDGQFDDSTVVNPCWTWERPGTYAVCLRVTDSVPAENPELDVDVDCATVVVRELLATLVSIDIKPGSDPNSINPGEQGVIPVAILTTEEFDAAMVDPETVVFAGAQPKHYALENVDRRQRDRDIDLILQFETQDTDIAPGNDAACLTGETYDGMPIIGCDSVRTVP